VLVTTVRVTKATYGEAFARLHGAGTVATDATLIGRFTRCV
jgi:hypothetical protein